MVKIRTLNELSQLRDSEFNQEPPRHGLNLLYWFAHDVDHLNPSAGAFGFHRFYNRMDDDDDDDLLPKQNFPYYEVGNLNARGADKLPRYVRPSNSHYYKEYNKDRIIVRLNNGCIDRVYVTEHEDEKNFNHSRTYRVSQGLLDHIRRISERKQFLKHMQKQPQPQAQQSDSSGSWCTIL